MERHGDVRLGSNGDLYRHWCGPCVGDDSTDAGALVFVLREPIRMRCRISQLWNALRAAAGERITFTSPTVGGLLPGNANANGDLALIWQCNPNESGRSWTVTAVGQGSGRSGTFTVTGS